MDCLKKCELEILKTFLKVCDKLGLKYYLVEGTLLGAVRHKGFIPWDDDIDVGMPRADYERFLAEAQPLMPDYYFIQSICSEPDYHVGFAKIRDSRTTFIESSVRYRKINHGVYIDVFPLDFCPESKLYRTIINIRNLVCVFRVNQIFSLPSTAPKQPLHKELVFRFLKMYSRIRYPRLRQAVLTQNRLFSAVDHSRLMVNYGSAWGKREVVPSEWYGEGTILTFEDLNVRVPSEYDKLLTNIYGDYMTPPPPEKRIGHHYAEVIDLDKPYTEYIKDNY